MIVRHCGRPRDRQQAVVVHEARVGAHRELERMSPGPPTRSTHRTARGTSGRTSASNDRAARTRRSTRRREPPTSGATEPEAVGARPVGLVADQAPRRAVESDDVGKQPQNGRVEGVAPLREDRIQIRSAELETGRDVGHTEAHLARLRRHAELTQQRDEPRIVALVVDDEAGVDGVVRTVDLDVDGVCVTSDPRRQPRTP